MSVTAAAGAAPRRVAAAAFACAAAAALTLPLAQPPALIGPLHVGAGIALAVALVHGVRAGAIALTALFLAQLGMRAALGQTVAVALSLAAAATVAPALAMACGRLFPPVDLDRPQIFVRFAVFGAALPATVATVLAAALGSEAGVIATANLIDVALLWWFADMAGIVLVTPIALVALRAPGAAWASHRHVVWAPLAALAGLLLIGSFLLARAEADRRAHLFQRDADAIAARVQARFDEYVSALHSVAGAFAASEDVTREEFRALTAYWLQRQPTLTAIGWSARLARGQLAEFEQRQQRERPTFRVFDRDERGRPSAPAPADEYVIVTYIEPEAANAAALGVNALSVAAPREAIVRALETGAPSATAPFRLTQAPEAGFGIVVYLPAQARGGASAESQRGVAFVTLRLDGALADLADPMLVICLRERQTDGRDVLLAGDARCLATPTGVRRLEHAFEFGGRPLVVEIAETAEHRALAGSGTPRVLAPMAGGLSALLAAFVLLAAGRAERVRRIVERRTEWLRRQMQQRRSQAEALRASEERLRRILDLAPVGITYTDPDGRFVYANPHFCAMLGRSAEAVLGLTVADIWHPQMRSENLEIRRRLLAGDPPVLRRTLRLLHADGREVAAEVTAVVERDAAGQPLRVLTVVEELSARMRLQEAERARQLAEQANRAKTEFLSRMSHELRTPLNAILGFAQLLELDAAQPLAPGQRERVRRIQEAGWHLLEMINDVLDLSRIESGAVRLSLETVDLTALAHEALAMQRDAAARAGLTVTEALDPAARHARGDATRIRQVLSNLLSNAIKYNRAGGRITLATERTGERVRVHVADSGIGMTQEQIERLFQPFERLGRESSGIEGTGIGLVIARRLVELMGGELTVDSQAGQGTRFTFTLAAADAPPAAAAAPAPAAGRSLRGTLLYVEDNSANAEVMRSLVATQPGLHLLVCDRGLLGLQTARRERPDLILLDLNLPDVEGLALLAQIKRDPQLQSVPVVVISADALPERIAAARHAGAADYLTKPIRVEGLLALLARLLPT